MNAPTNASWQWLLELDETGSRRLRIAEQPGITRSLAVLLAHSGDSWFWGLAMALVWFFLPEWRSWAAWLFAGILVLAIGVLAIKFSVRRSRPKGDWGKIYRQTDPHSFPSGHAARAALLATATLVIGPPWMGWFLLVWAPLVMLARVAMGVHFLSDVLAGAILGVAFSAFWLGVMARF